MFEPWKNGHIEQQVEVKAAAAVTIGNYDHYQVRPEDDGAKCRQINADLETFHSTERIGPPGDSNDPARFREIRSVTYSRYVDAEGRAHWAMVASQ